MCKLINFYIVKLSFDFQIHFAMINRPIQESFQDVPSPSELVANMSGVLINSNHAVDYPKLLPPTYIEIAGIHLKPPKPLSEVVFC